MPRDRSLRQLHLNFGDRSLDKNIEADVQETACGVFATDDVAVTGGQEQCCEGREPHERCPRANVRAWLCRSAASGPERRACRIPAANDLMPGACKGAEAAPVRNCSGKRGEAHRSMRSGKPQGRQNAEAGSSQGRRPAAAQHSLKR